MTARVFKNPIAIAILAILALVLLSATFAVVPETKQALIVRFGEPLYVVNRYQPRQDFGNTGAGIIGRVPFVDKIEWVDKRVQSIDMEQQRVLSTDQQPVEIDAFARYRIVDPLRMYKAAGSQEGVSRALQPILGSALRNELGKRPFAALLSPERGAVMQNIRVGLNRVAAQYGAQIIDVRIKRADLPEGEPLNAAYTRMRSAREQEARSIRAQGAKSAQIIRADADAEASKTYADSFGKDADFYDFYRAMQSYQITFVNNGGKMGTSNIVLSPNNEYLREFQGRSR